MTNIEGANKIWQDLRWKVHCSAKSFVLLSYTMHELRNQHVSIGQFLNTGSKPLLRFVDRQSQKSEQKHTTKNFVEFHNHPSLLTMFAIPTDRQWPLEQPAANRLPVYWRSKRNFKFQIFLMYPLSDCFGNGKSSPRMLQLEYKIQTAH